jgi:tetratricopeptide (TPR) repeat protein
LAALVLAPSLRAQSRNAAKHSKAVQSSPQAAADPLGERLAAAREAQQSGDPAEVGRANQRLLALAFRELAQIRLLEGAFPQAIGLYKNSLALEDAPGARVDLAIAYLRAGDVDQSLKEAGTALLADPESARAYNIQGKAWMKKQDYAKAADSLAHSVNLKPDFEAAYSLGICLLATQDPRNREQAREVFRQMEQLAGDSGSLHVLFGRAYRDANLLPDAIHEMNRAIAVDSATPHAHYFLGLLKLMQNEWVATPEIRAEFRAELRRDPKDFLANYLLGFVDSNARQYAESDRYLRNAAASNPAWPEPYLYMGLNAYSQGDIQHAETEFRKAIELTGTDLERSNYQIRKAYINLGRILEASGRKEEGERYLDEAREMQKLILEAGQQTVAVIASKQNASRSAAVVPLSAKTEEQAAAPVQTPVDPSAQLDASVLERANLTAKEKQALTERETQLRAVLATGFNDWATSEAIRRQYAPALEHYQEAERWDPGFAGLSRNIGLAAFRSGDYAEAAPALEKALAAQPADAPVRAMLGVAYFSENKFADAVKTFAPLGEKGMSDPVAGYAWAASLARQNDARGAAEVLKHLDPQRLEPDSLLATGQLWTALADYARATECFKLALQKNPALPEAHYYAGLAYTRWEKFADAETEFKAELKLNPHHALAKDSLGFLYVQQNWPADAAALFREVITEHPDDSRAQYQLGKLLLEQNQVKEAITHLEAAARLSPDTDYVHYQLQAAYRKDARIEDADRELQIYKNLKSASRQNALPPMGEPRP